VYKDANNNRRYDLNEGLANITVTAGTFTTKTNGQGGYSLKVPPDNTYSVTARGLESRNEDLLATVKVEQRNVEVDFIQGSRAIVNFEGADAFYRAFKAGTLLRD